MASDPPKSSTRLKKLWVEAEQSFLNELQPKDRALVERIDTKLGFTSFLESLRGSPTLEVTMRFFDRLDKISRRLEPFCKILDVLALGSGSPTNLVWGALKLAVEITGRFLENFELVVKMLEETVSLMPRFQLYTTIFPNSPGIDMCIVELYKEFMGFCVTSITFFGRGRILTRLTWSRDRRQFRQMRNRIKSLTETIEREASVSNIEASHQVREEVRKAISRPQVEERRSGHQSWSNIPYPRNRSFQHREEILEQIHNCLSPEIPENKTKMNFVTLHGLGGIGKTQIALEYIYRYQSSYTARFWVTSDTPAKIAQGFAEIARKLKLGDGGHWQIQSLVKEWFCDTEENWLLVFDNAEDLEGIRDYWPPSTRGSILLTSQNPDWLREDLNLDQSIRIKEFSKNEGTEMLVAMMKKHKLPSTEDSAAAIVEELGGLPLAIRQMGSYISTTGLTLPAFMDIYKDQLMASKVDEWSDSAGISYKFTISAVFRVAFDKLSPQSRFLMDVIAFFDPDYIPQELFWVGEKCNEDWTFCKSRSDYEDALRQLRKYSLVNRTDIDGDSAITVHRLVKKHSIRRMNSSEFRKAFDCALYLLLQVFPRESPLAEPMSGNWSQCERFISHILSLQLESSVVRQDPSCPELLAELFKDGAIYLWERGLLEQATSLVLTAKDICERPNRNDLLRAEVYAFHACILHDSGDIDQACHFFEEQAKLRRQHLQLISAKQLKVTIEDEIQLANAYNNLASVYCSQGRYDESELFLSLSFEIKKRWEQEADMEFLLGVSYANQANLYGQQGQFDKSAELFEKALSMSSNKHFTAKRALTIHNYGCMRFAQGRIGDALCLHMESYRIRSETLRGHYDTANSLHMLACCHHKLGDLSKAIEELQKGLGILESLAHPDRRRIARTKFKLALVLIEVGDPTGEELKVEAVSLKENLTGVPLEADDAEDAFNALVSYI
ncbi:MAG: hypothetical protein M1813_001626 [Trichoglossum hirsutum]|nr:MAG: hypothetical protein M1813_001626 [Trichoglossum hirsutum]